MSDVASPDKNVLDGSTFRAIAGHSAQPALMVERETGRVRFANSKAAQAFGCDREALIGRDIRDVASMASNRWPPRETSLSVRHHCCDGRTQDATWALFPALEDETAAVAVLIRPDQPLPHLEASTTPCGWIAFKFITSRSTISARVA